MKVVTKRIFEPFGNLLQREFQSVPKSFFLWWKFVFVSENGFFKFSTVVESLQKERLSICFQKTFDGDIFQPLWVAYCINSTVKGWYTLFSFLNFPFFLSFSEKKYFCAAASQLTLVKSSVDLFTDPYCPLEGNDDGFWGTMAENKKICFPLLSNKVLPWIGRKWRQCWVI